MFRRSAVVACLILLVTATSLPAVEHPSELFSPDVSLIVRYKNPQATVEKIAALADAIQPGFGLQVKANAQGIGQGISNPTLAGVDQEKDWWLGVFASGDEEPTIVFVIPATDAAAMKEAVQQAGEFTFFTHESWGIYTADVWTADNVKACIDGKKKPLVAGVDEDLQATFEGGDLSVFINVAQLAKTYDNNVQEAKEELAQQAENAPPAAQMMLGMYLDLANPLFQALDDASGAVVAVAVDKSGVSLETLANFKKETKTAKLFGAANSENALLQRLPTDGQAYFAMSSVPTALQQWSVKMMEASSELVDQDEETLDRFKDVMRRMQKLKYGGMAAMFSVVEEGEHPGIRTATVMDMEQPKQMRLLTKEMTASQSELNFGGVTTKYEYTEDAETYGKLKADTIKVEQEFEDNPFFQMGEIFDVIFGEEGMLTRAVYTDKQVVQTMGGGKEAMQSLLNRLDQSPAPGQEPAFKTTRAALSKQANLIVLVDLPGTAARFARLILGSGLFPIPVEPDVISVPETKSYFGLSVATQERGVRVKIHLPAEQAKQSYLFGMQVYQAVTDFQQQFN